MRLLLTCLAASLIAVLPTAPRAEVINIDSGFENPASDPGGSPLGWGDFSSWAFTAPEEPYDTKLSAYLRQGAESRWGAQHVEVELLGASGESNSLLVRQMIASVPDGQNLALRLHLKQVGSAPAGGEIRVFLDHLVSGQPEWSDSIAYEDLADGEWKTFSFWPVRVPDGGSATTNIAVGLIFSTDGDAQDFSVLIDDVTLEDIPAPDGGFLEHLSFESKNPDVLDDPNDPSDFGSHTFASEFSFDSVNAPHEWDTDESTQNLDLDNLTIETDGGSDGAQYVRAASADGTCSDWCDYTLDLHSDPTNYYLDTDQRFTLSVDLRYSGTPPEPGSNRIDFSFYEGTVCDEDDSIRARKRVLTETLTDEFRTYSQGVFKFPAADGNGNPTYVAGENPYCVRVFTQLANAASSNIEIDNVQVDRIAPMEMYPGSDVVLLDAEIDPGLPTFKPGRPVPTTFYTDSYRSDQQKKTSLRVHASSEYRLYLPEGITVVTAPDGTTGSDPATWDETGIGEGDGRPYYTVDETGNDYEFDGETYWLWKLSIQESKWSKTDVQFYLDSTLPADTSNWIYYETLWTTNPTETHPDWDPNAEWNTGRSEHVRRVEVQTREFPRIERPDFLTTSLGWIGLGDILAWPGYMESHKTFGFSHVAAHQDNFYEKIPGTYVSQTELDFYAEAAAEGYGNYGIVSPFAFNWFDAAESIDPSDSTQSVRTADGERMACPAYGLPHRNPDGTLQSQNNEQAYCPPGDRHQDDTCGLDDGVLYDDDLVSVGSWVAATNPSHLQIDSEAFGYGAELALGERTGINDQGHEVTGCKRCNDYLANYQSIHPGATMADALEQMGADRAVAVMDAILDEQGTVPQIGFYHTAGDGVITGGFPGADETGVGDQTYLHVYNNKRINDALRAHPQNVLEYPSQGRYPLYSIRPSIINMNVTALNENVRANDLQYVPILLPGGHNTAHPESWTYDRVLEIFGAGAVGVEFFPYEQFEGGDIYHFAKAMESVLKVEHVIADAEAVATGLVPDIPDEDLGSVDESLYGVRASVIRKEHEYVILVSSYGTKGNSPDGPIIDEDPLWTGRVVVSFPAGQSLAGIPIRLADDAPGSLSMTGTTANLHLDFVPGADGAHTALYYFCDSSGGAGMCDDGDSDSILDVHDNCPSDSNHDQADADGDGIGDACDTVAGSLCNEVPLHQYWNALPSVIDHSLLTGHFPNGLYGYTYDGPIGSVCTTQIDGTIPLYRYFAGAPWYDSHYSTIYEANGVYAYDYAGFIGYVFEEKDPRITSELVPLHYYYKPAQPGPASLDHWVTPIEPTVGVPGYTYQHTIGYVPE